ncbi:MAG: TusE/DsrC/DsvC family sulfur relay protein [bacterium]|nr:TusE/DsrC/DsvC family sulfur relay protein [bacterium]
MPIFENGKIRVDLDEKGYLLDPEQWNDKVAQALAQDEGIDKLTEEHWRVIDYLREFQEEHNTAPMIRILCRETGYTLMQIYDLFENGPAKGACRVAGLPRPDSCV